MRWSREVRAGDGEVVSLARVLQKKAIRVTVVAWMVKRNIPLDAAEYPVFKWILGVAFGAGTAKVKPRALLEDKHDMKIIDKKNITKKISKLASITVEDIKERVARGRRLTKTWPKYVQEVGSCGL